MRKAARARSAASLVFEESPTTDALYSTLGELYVGRIDVGREGRNERHSWLRGLSGCFNVRDRSRSPSIKNGERARVANVFVTDRWDVLQWDARITTIGNRELPGDE